MKQPRVLITDDVHEVLPKGLQDLGYKIDYQPNITLTEVRSMISGYQGLVINSKILVDKELLDVAQELRWVGRLGSGLEIIDQAYAKTCGVVIIASPEGNAPAVGEHATAMLLALLTNLRQADTQVRRFTWNREKVRGKELRSCKVGIIGYGNTGPAFAKTLRGFGCSIAAYDKYKPDFTEATPWVKAAQSAEEVFRTCNVLSLHLPLTAETIDYLKAEQIAQLQAGSILINTSRGKAVSLPDLLTGLESGHLGGAALDVFPNEKPHTFNTSEQSLMSRLSALDQVILSPHVAGWTVESKRALAEIVLKRVQQLSLDVGQASENES